MKVNFNFTDLKMRKHQPCNKCVFDKVSDHYFCGLLPRICFIDGQVYVQTENLYDVFNL